MWRLGATEDVDDDLITLARGPDIRVRKFSTCVVNGVRFNTDERDKNKKTQNSGLACIGGYKNEKINYYGTLKEIIELEYTNTNTTVVVFRCDWYKLDGKHTSLLATCGTRRIVIFWQLKRPRFSICRIISMARTGGLSKCLSIVICTMCLK
jgi:hypothetical protein